MASLRTNIEERGEVLVLKLSGDLTSHCAPSFGILWRKQVATGHHKVAIDFTEVGLLSSAGIGEIVSLTREVQSKDGGLALCNLNETCTDALELTGLLPILNVFSNLDAGIIGLINA